MIKTAVDLAAPPNAPAFHVGNFVAAEGDSLATVPVFLQHFIEGKGAAGFARIKRAFFDQQDVAARFSQ